MHSFKALWLSFSLSASVEAEIRFFSTKNAIVEKAFLLQDFLPSRLCHGLSFFLRLLESKTFPLFTGRIIDG